jgi:ADP-ribosylglycohydrolase
MEEVVAEAERSAAVTHDHPEGIKGARAAASAVYLARKGMSKKQIKEYIEDSFSYNLSCRLDDIRDVYHFDETCQGSVPQAITAFLESESFEDAIRKAVSIGGDSDTIACITGGIAEAFYREVPGDIREEVAARLDTDLVNIIDAFYERFKPGRMI